VYGKRAVSVWFARNAVDAVETYFIFLKIIVAIVDAYRPESVNGHVFDLELVSANWEIWLDVEIVSLLFRQASPTPRRA